MSVPAVAPPPPAPIVDLLANPRYSQANYVGRVQNFFSVIDPRTLLTSEADIKQSVKLLEQYRKGQTQGITQEQIWNARKIKVQTQKHAFQMSVALLAESRDLTVAFCRCCDAWCARDFALPQDSCVHPDTGDIIFPLARFSAFVPVNIPLVRTNTHADTAVSHYHPACC